MKLFSAIILLGLTLGPSFALAQPQYFYRRPDPKEPKSRISFSGQVLFGIETEVQNLGNIGYPTTGGDSDVLLFNDGYVAPHPGGGEATSDYGFEMDNARYDADGYVTSFDLTRYRSESLGTTAAADLSSAYGWEVAYDYQWGTRTDRFRLGIRAGISLNNLDFASTSTVDGRLIFQRATFDVPDGTISHEEGGSYQGSGSGGSPAIDIDPAQDLTGGAGEQEVVEPVWNGEDVVVPSRVNSIFTLDGLLANLRVGPTLAMQLAWGFDLELSAGLMGVYYTSDITMRERLLNLPTNETIFAEANAQEFESGTEGEFLFGVYGEGLLRYRATERVSLYSSLLYMSVQDPSSRALDSVDYQISFETPVIATGGLSVQF